MGRKRKATGFSNNQIITEAMDNGIIIRLDPLEYPIFILPGAYARDAYEKQLKGSAAFDAELFMKQNNLAKKPRKSEVRKMLEKGIQNMNLTLSLLTQGIVTDPQTGNDYIMGPTKEQASYFYAAWRREQKKALAKYDDIEQRDAYLVKAYAKGIIDLAPYIKSLNKLYKKHKKEIDAAALIRPGATKSKKKATKKSRKSASKKHTASNAKATHKRLTATEVKTKARTYNRKKTKTGEYQKLVGKFGKVNAQRILSEAKKQKA